MSHVIPGFPSGPGKALLPSLWGWQRVETVRLAMRELLVQAPFNVRKSHPEPSASSVLILGGPAGELGAKGNLWQVCDGGGSVGDRGMECIPCRH